MVSQCEATLKSGSQQLAYLWPLQGHVYQPTHCRRFAPTSWRAGPASSVYSDCVSSIHFFHHHNSDCYTKLFSLDSAHQSPTWEGTAKEPCSGFKQMKPNTHVQTGFLTAGANVNKWWPQVPHCQPNSTLFKKTHQLYSDSEGKLCHHLMLL